MKKETVSDEQKQMTTKESQMYVRQQKVWDLLMQDCSQEKIAKKLGVSTKTISRDVEEIKKDSVQWMDNLHKGQLQVYYRSDLESVDKVNEELWEICRGTKDKKLKVKILSSIFGNKVIHIKMLSQSKLFELGKELHLDEAHRQISSGKFNFGHGGYPRTNENGHDKI